MRTLDKESELLDRYRNISSCHIKYLGCPIACRRIEVLTRCRLFRKSWIDTSKKSDLPPDFHNDKHHIMMEMMRIDDALRKVKGKRVLNAFEKENLYLRKNIDEDYKTIRDDVSVHFTPYTDDPEKYTYNGYVKNFERIVLDHASHIENYKSNYKECKKIIFFISDESNEFCETENEEDKRKVERGTAGIKVKWHVPHCDNRFIEVIKQSKCDYIIWFQWYKNTKRRFRLLVPRVLIIDVKHFKKKGIDYNSKLMAKVKEIHP